MSAYGAVKRTLLRARRGRARAAAGAGRGGGGQPARTPRDDAGVLRLRADI